MKVQPDVSAAVAAVLGDALGRYAGQRFVGVVDGGGCVELVFSERPDGANLLTVWLNESGGPASCSHGFVVEPEAYVAAQTDREA